MRFLPDLVLAATPYRLSFGGAADSYEVAKLLGETAFINTGIQVFAHVLLMRRIFDQDIFLHHTWGREIRKPFQIESIKHDLLREGLKLTGIEGSIEILLFASISSKKQGGLGLGSSSAFCVAILHALHAFKGEEVTPLQLAEEACQIEIDILKKPMGIQDQYAAAFGTLNEYRLNKNGKVKILPIKADLNQLEKNLLLFFTGGSRFANDVLVKQKAKLEDNLSIYKDLISLVPKIRESLEADQIEKLGILIDKGWQLKKMLDHVSSPFIDKIYDLALKNGAIGGRLVGAGGSGYLLFVVPKENQTEVKEVFKKRGLPELPLKFSRSGSKIIFRKSLFKTKVSGSD